MIVNDLIPDVIDAIGYINDEVLFGRISDAIDVLATKGDFDGLTAYLDINVDNLTVSLPDDVLSPIKILINDHPSFSRSQIYEFTMNGPTTDMREVRGWNWMDNQYSPVLRQPASPSPISITSDDSRDDGVTVYMDARDADGRFIHTHATFGQVNTFPGADPDPDGPAAPLEASAGVYAYIDRIYKPVTIGRVRVVSSVDHLQLAHYLPRETDPQYRQIRVSEGDHLKIVYKRRTYRVNDRFDFIPVKSKVAIVMMCRALEAFRKAKTPEDMTFAKALEDTAIMRIKEDQQSRHTAEANAQQTEVQSALDLNYNNIDSLIVADIYDSAASIFGPVGRECLFDYISDAKKLMNGKAMWDSQEGYVDLLTTDFHYLTLPRYIDNPIAINVNGRPKAMRNEWYEFHLNGPGSDMLPCNTWHYVGIVPIIRPLPDGTAASLLAHCELSQDAGKKIRVFGWDQNGKKTYSNYGGVYQEGVEVNITFLPPTTPLHTSADVLTAPKISRIERIEKDETVGFVHLNAFFPDIQPDIPLIPLGYYQPDETTPNYVQIRIPQRSAWVRMRYRKRESKVISLTEPIHLRSQLAMVLAMQAVKAYNASPPDLKAGGDAEAKALQLLKEEMESRRPPGDSWTIQYQGTKSEVIL